MQHDDRIVRNVGRDGSPDHLATVQDQGRRWIDNRRPEPDGGRHAPCARAFAATVGALHPIVIIPARDSRRVVEGLRASRYRTDPFGGVGIAGQVAPDAVVRFSFDVVPRDGHVVGRRPLRGGNVHNHP